MTRPASHLVWLLVVLGCRSREPTSPGPSNAGSSARAGASAAGGGSGSVGQSTPSPDPPPFDASGCRQPQVVANCTAGFCTIPAGCFVMGSPETDWGRGSKNENRVAVTLTRAFEIGQHEVTQREWTAQGYPNPSKKFDAGPSAGQGDCLEAECPVGNVNWFEAASFANRLSEAHDPPLEPCYELLDCKGKVGQGLRCTSATLATSTVYDCQGYRLPTDAEWEYAARAGTTTSFYTGNIGVHSKVGPCYRDGALEPIAWYCDNATGSTHVVGGLQPNAWGLYDMIGNAYEWVHNRFSGISPDGPVSDPFGAADETWPERSVRSCAYYSWSTLCRVSSYSMHPWNLAAPGSGFRLARTLE